ncbi:MAG: hypothetical protein ACRDO8_01865 [Nocardioidaceae bacterium]
MATETPAPVVVELRDLGPTVARGVRLLLEAAVVPTMLLYACVHTVGTLVGLVAVLGWCALTLGVRWLTARRLPGTLLLAIGMLVARSSLALVLSSVYVYLLQPVVGSVLMAVLFLGSAAAGRPVTIRLAQDFVALPSQLFRLRAVRRMFTQVSLLWGGSRLLDAAMSLGFLRWGVESGLLSRGIFSGALTALSVVLCAYWGWTRLRAVPGVVIRIC